MREWLQSARRHKNYTQEETARRVGIVRSYYSRIERGEYKIPVDTAKRIAQVLELDWNIFYKDE